MKNRATQSRDQTLDIHPADQIAAGAMDNAGFVETTSHQILADLVWKYFGEEITQALQEAQQALEAEKVRSTTAKSQER